MKNIGLLIRKRIVEDLKDKVKETNGCFFVGFNKVEAFSFNELRNNLKDSSACVFVTKNRLFKKALSDLGWEGVDELLEAETGVVLVYDKDIVKVCKVISEFAKESEALKIKGGFIKDKKINPKDVDVLAKLPSKDVLLGMAVSSIAAPLTGFLNSLNQIILKFLWVIEEVKKSKEK